MSSPALSFTVEVRPDLLPDDQREAVLANPGFGKTFTDHMVLATWTTDQGWHDAKVTAYGPLMLDPSAAVLHYAQEIFEGMKAYRHADGSVWTFRPEVNAARFARSAQRLALPELSAADFIASLKALVTVDEKWVPAGNGGEASLYLRPFMFASESFLGVRPAASVTYWRDRLSGGSVLRGRPEACLHLAVHRLHARRTGWHRPGQVRWQLRSEPGRTVQGSANGCDQVAFLDAVERKWSRSSADEPLLRAPRRHHRDPGADRDDPRGCHAILHPRARR